MKVLIFGCGPAGLMAAHAAALNNCDVLIVSKKRKSEMFGCQYLHQPIPLVTQGDPVDVEYKLQGSIKDYRQKVYGNKSVDVSPDTLETNHKAWNIRSAYDNLWAMYGSYVIDQDVSGGRMDQPRIQSLIDDADWVYSTIPAPLLCKRIGEHNFFAEQVWAIGDAPERGIFSPVTTEENTILCNGHPAPSWYRVSNVFGYNTVEWPGGKKPPIQDIAEVVKPIKTDCDCRPKIHRLGRYGKWQKGVLSHEAFTTVANDLEKDWTLF